MIQSVQGLLKADIVMVEDLSENHLERMYSLMAENYDAMSPEKFEKDLKWKDEVIFLRDEESKIWGFSTLAWNPKGWNGEVDIVFSGDTIIAEEAWGSQELVRAFCHRAGEWRLASQRRLFWFLISKGHRTYLYLPLFAKRFFPSPDRNEDAWGELAGAMAEKIFGAAWREEFGILRFAKSEGQLKEELADDSGKRENNRYVKFFLEENPDFRKGDELVCLTEMAESNLKRGARKAFLEGRGN